MDEYYKPIVIEYLKAYPAMSSRDMARLLCAETNGLFKDSEQARTLVRYYRGSKGESSRNVASREIIPRIAIPESDIKSLEPFVITAEHFPLIVGGDAHFPYHDEEAVEIFFERAAEMEAKTIVLLGDWMDMYQASCFVKDPRARRIPDEIDQMREFLIGVREAFPHTRIIYKIGNHEDRLDTYIRSRAPELYGLADVTLERLLHLDELNIECVPSRQMIKFGKLYGLHGHEIGKGVFSPVNPARGLYLKTKKSAICAHYHQTSLHGTMLSLALVSSGASSLRKSTTLTLTVR